MLTAITAITAVAVAWRTSRRLRARAYGTAARVAGRVHCWLVAGAGKRPAPAPVPTAADIMHCWVALHA